VKGTIVCTFHARIISNSYKYYSTEWYTSRFERKETPLNQIPPTSESSSTSKLHLVPPAPSAPTPPDPLKQPLRHGQRRRIQREKQPVALKILTIGLVLLVSFYSVVVINFAYLWPMNHPEPTGVDRVLVVNPALSPSVTTTPRPPDAGDVVIKADVPLRIEIPAIGLDSAEFCTKKGDNPIIKWTMAMEVAAGNKFVPPDPFNCTFAWDSTLAGGGLFGTDAACPGTIAGHTTPNGWPDEYQGVFQNLRDLKVGDVVAVSTKNGKIFYRMTVRDSLLKGETGLKYRSFTTDECASIEDGSIMYVAACDRNEDDDTNNATTRNLMLTMQVDQKLTNAQSFGKVIQRTKEKDK